MPPQALADKPQSAAKPAAEARRYQNFINGQWVDSSSGKTTPNINPANTDDIIGHAPQSTREEAQARSLLPKPRSGWRNTRRRARTHPRQGGATDLRA